MSIVGGLLRFLIGGIAVFADQILRVPEIAFFIWSHSRQINVKTRLGFKEMSKGATGSSGCVRYSTLRQN
jgi:hypothetical protein